MAFCVVKRLSVAFALAFGLAGFAAAHADEPVKKPWTFLIYVNGHNNLSSLGYEDINEMEAVGSTDQVNVVVQQAREDGNTRRLFIQQDADMSTVTSPVVYDFGTKADMGSADTLTDFIVWGAQNYPADHYFVAVWNHGAGWHDFLQRTKGISYDDEFGSHLTTKQYAGALREASHRIGHKIDVVGNDACLMASLEVAGEMSDVADYYVGSEELEPGDGWPYDDFLRSWNALNHATPTQVAQALVRDYVASYSSGSQGSSSVTFSAFDVKALSQLNEPLSRLKDEILSLSSSQKKQLVTVANNTQDFYESDYKDLGDFLLNLRSAPALTSAQTLDALDGALSKVVIANATTSHYARAKGATLWIPTSQWQFKNYRDDYRELNFNQSNQWLQALESLFASN